ncbi:Polygalacturonase [Cinnamomum micranthum f. kanehirae]|uniref:endo-polygalacturonase n=1 Tax=Cinnamomum micranthum f. kanehirae TaxID=337451 RepID=A0A443NGV7_9MAGN|nr:Polygalacturonase [Cinnamomum micranthum f. kanehirae]
MSLERYLLPISILCFCCNTCYRNPLEGRLSNCVDEQSGFKPINSRLRRLDNVGSSQTSTRVVNVDDFGAKGDGTDDTKQAFEKAWEEACSFAPSVFVVPKNKNYLLKPITFSGPCRSSITFKILGSIEASSHQSDWNSKDGKHWLLFRMVDNLRVEGGGTVNGNGKTWWEKSCKTNKLLPCKTAPTALTFYSCKSLILSNLRIKDSQQMHVSIEECVNVVASHLIVTAPDTSPNTDGIHIAGTRNIQIMNCVIGTGDDCISIVSGSLNVKATNITCGPGHGISIGSLGHYESKAHVAKVVVDGANIFGTTNGVRIKTWKGGSGNARDIKFQNIVMHDVIRPIVIDQNYCDSKDPCPEQHSAVEVSNVIYKGIKGTSASEAAVTFDCSTSFPCHGIVLQDINLVGNGGRPTTGSCKNVEGISEWNVYPPCF